ncbi:MAG: adenylate/guanylate cyclase domain-containing protein [Usitatibacter sp.]
METLRQAFARHAEAAIAASVFAVVALVATTVPAWQGLERRVFDFLTVKTAKGEISQPITLIAINEEAMAAMKQRLPWPRKLYAQMIERVASGGAAVIALDIVFFEPSNPEDDAALAKAIARAGNVVLASSYTYDENSALRMWKRVDPIPTLLDAGAIAGQARVPFDADQFVRRIPDDPDAFWRQVVKVLQVKAPSHPVPALPESSALIRYMGPDSAFDPIPFHLVLEASPEELKTAFGGRIVIVGRDLQATAEIGMAQADMFATPFLSISGGLTAGIKIHATLVDNALSGTWLKESTPGRNLALFAFAAVLSFLGMRPGRRPGVAFATFLAVAAFCAGLGWYTFTQERLWIPVAGPIAIALAIYLAYLARAYLTESRRKRELQRAFGLYVSPAVVDQIVNDPRRAMLGGERREITVLFTDLAGFTTLTEKTAPDVVQQVLTRHFTVLTEVVLASHGTVVSFMGDGMMAFWGAPLDDPEHAFEAVQAAIEMQRRMKELAAELVAQGLPEVRMRVGVNTCEAVVGNMGSETRFAYTAMGDGVNLSSRLEGCNKLYGTPILVSGDTVAKLGGRIPMRRVDRIKVAGKALAVDVFTPVEDAQVAEKTASAFDAYARGDLEAAAALYAELQQGDRDDRVAARLIERIEKWRRDPSLVSADGSVALDKM